MPVVFAGIVPNSPRLLPGLVPTVRSQVVKTVDGMAKLKRLAESTQPEILLIIGEDDLAVTSPVLLQAPNFTGSFAELGDLVTNVSRPGAVGFIHSLKEKLQLKLEIPMQTPKKLPTSLALPLLYLPDIAVAPIVLPHNPSPQLLIDFGQELGDFLATQKKRVLLVAAGHLAVAKPTNDDKMVLARALLRGIASSNSDALLELATNLKSKLNDTLIFPVILTYRSLPTSNPKITVLVSEEVQGIIHVVGKISW
ncbi:TPA: hypothetical protein DIC39_02500 [Patescibacteria group bacterium]|nr:MAG: hypothetical protein UX54_C0009G0010 [Parcubacteria group bacterium GW2011_GWA2_46_39]HBV33440.1 hypothetical protein [Patescibacteria group bacterium]HCU47903.1 hypothetical protein [Patescibacteria group bacterium]